MSGPNRHVRAALALLAALNVVIGLLVLAGCSKSDPSKRGAAGATGGKQSSALTECISLWSAGNQDSALEKFIAIDWTDASLFPSGTPLGYAESDLASLPQAQSMQVASEAQQAGQALKQICARLKQVGEQARAAGNNAKAEVCFKAIDHCGTALDQPNRLKLFQLIGKTIKKMAGQ